MLGLQLRIISCPPQKMCLRKKSCPITQLAVCVLFFRVLQCREKCYRVGLRVVQRNHLSCPSGHSVFLLLLQDESQKLGLKRFANLATISFSDFICCFRFGHKNKSFSYLLFELTVRERIPLYFLSMQTCGYLDQTTYNWGMHKTDLLVNLHCLIHM